MIKIGQYISLSGLEKENIEGNMAPEMDCYNFYIETSNRVNIYALKCDTLHLYLCHDIYISCSLINNIIVKDCYNIHFIRNIIKKNINIDKTERVHFDDNNINCGINEA